MAATPVITTDWGAFTENVRHGLTGYRCRTLKQFVQAAKDAEKLDCNAIHMEAQRKYSMWAIRHQYEEYFKSLKDLWGDGWYTV
jgi:glycosyltransferase involved in cell wall biosynthesis